MPGKPIENFSYATEHDPRLKRILIRAVERMTGQPYLKRLYDAHRREPKPGETFWTAALRMLDVRLICNEDALTGVPATGPLVIVANHPFGVLDGLIISHLVSRVRNDFLVLTNSVLYRAEEIRAHLLPIDFTETRQALRSNVKSRAEAKAHLGSGGCLVIFPAGGASTVRRPWSRRAIDAEWKTLTARLIHGAKAAVTPIYFAGQNSRLFQIASHISLSLRLSLFFQEVTNKIGREICVRIGGTIPYKDLAELDSKAMMEHLKQKTYALGAGLPHKIARDGGRLRTRTRTGNTL